MRSRWLAGSLLLVAATFAAPVSASSSGSGRYIVVLRNGSDPEASARVHEARYGAKADRYYRSALSGYAANVPEDRVDDLRNDPSVIMVSPNRVFHAAAQTTPTGVSRIKASTIAGTGDGVQVAVIDSGIDLQHPDLAANIVGGVDCDGPDNGNYDDAHGHGTHVAGTIAAIDNSIGVRGVAPAADLLAVRVLNQSGTGSTENLVCGLNWVDAHAGQIRVANMSLELFQENADDGNCGLTNDDPVHFAICAVVDDGVTVVAAAGNFHDNIKDISPAAYDEVITATALQDYDGAPCSLGTDPPGPDDDDTFGSFSSYATTTLDKAHTIGAPGIDILSTWIDGYALSTGTSMASPHVAAVAARYLQTHPGTSPAGVLTALLEVGEPKDVNVDNECSGVSSHNDPSGEHPEPVVRVAEWELPIEATTPGVVRGNVWFLNNALDATGDVPAFAYGNPSDRLVVGDWDGDGIDSPGVVRGNVWYLNNDFDATGDVPVFAYGNPSDRVVVGDWNGDGVDSPGIVRGNVWYLNDDFDATGNVPVFAYGHATDKVVVGDWNHDDKDSPGIVRGNVFYLNNDFDPSGDIPPLAFGRSTDEPLVGDWDGDATDDIGVRRTGVWFLRTPDPVTVLIFPYGRSTDRAVVGDWDGANP